MRNAIVLMLLFSACSVAQDGKKDGPEVIFPTGPVVLVPPTPPPAPNAPIKLTPDLIYLIRSDKACLVITSPKGIVKVTAEQGPLRVRGVFWDGDGKQETRTFSEKYLWFVEPETNGTAEVIAIQPGATSEKDVTRRLVESQLTPRPPPVPPTPPDPPKPPPSPAPIPAPGLRVLIVEETSKRTQEIKNIIFNPELRTYLTKKCVTDADNPDGAWRIWDKDQDISAAPKLWRDAMARTRSSVPWIIISNGTNGFEGPLPVSVEETMKLVQKYEVK